MSFPEAPEVPTSASSELTEAERNAEIRNDQMSRTIAKIESIREVFDGELADLEFSLPEDFEVGKPNATVFDGHSSRAANDAEVRVFRVSIPDICFNVGADIRRQVSGSLADLALQCLQASINLRGEYEPLADAEEVEEPDSVEMAAA